MAIRVIRKCDKCGTEHEQNIDPSDEIVTYPVSFTCSDCVLREGKKEELLMGAHRGEN